MLCHGILATLATEAQCKPHSEHCILWSFFQDEVLEVFVSKVEWSRELGQVERFCDPERSTRLMNNTKEVLDVAQSSTLYVLELSVFTET